MEFPPTRWIKLWDKCPKVRQVTRNHWQRTHLCQIVLSCISICWTRHPPILCSRVFGQGNDGVDPWIKRDLSAETHWSENGRRNQGLVWKHITANGNILLCPIWVLDLNWINLKSKILCKNTSLPTANGNILLCFIWAATHLKFHNMYLTAGWIYSKLQILQLRSAEAAMLQHWSLISGFEPHQCHLCQAVQCPMFIVQPPPPLAIIWSNSIHNYYP